jgi:hypothetical protein
MTLTNADFVAMFNASALADALADEQRIYAVARRQGDTAAAAAADAAGIVLRHADDAHRRGLRQRAAVAVAVVRLVKAGRVTLDHAVGVVANPAAYMADGEVLVEEEGVSYSLWGNPVYW